MNTPGWIEVKFKKANAYSYTYTPGKRLILFFFSARELFFINVDYSLYSFPFSSRVFQFIIHHVTYYFLRAIVRVSFFVYPRTESLESIYPIRRVKFIYPHYFFYFFLLLLLLLSITASRPIALFM